MNYKNLLLILFFLTSCTVQTTQYSENIFSNRGFVLLYDDSLIEKKLLRKPLDGRSLEIVHNTLSKGTKVRITNLLNNKSTNAIVKTKNKNLFFYNSIFSKRIFEELDISPKEPYVEIIKIRESGTSKLSSRNKHGRETVITPISLDHLLGIQSCTQQTQFYMLLSRF